MSFGNWKEERRVPYPAEYVFETLVGALNHLGYQIERVDMSLMGVTAGRAAKPIWSSRRPFGGVRIAVAVDAVGDRQSKVTIEVGPSYAPIAFTPWWIKQGVAEVFDVLNKALAK